MKYFIERSEEEIQKLFESYDNEKAVLLIAKNESDVQSTIICHLAYLEKIMSNIIIVKE